MPTVYARTYASPDNTPTITRAPGRTVWPELARMGTAGPVVAATVAAATCSEVGDAVHGQDVMVLVTNTKVCLVEPDQTVEKT